VIRPLHLVGLLLRH